MSSPDNVDSRQEPNLDRYRHLIRELPITLRPSMNEQVEAWNTLFPFEQSCLAGMMNRLASLSPSDFAAITAPVRAIENRMGVRSWDFSEAEDTIENASLLARSPYYAEWRAQVEKFYENVNAPATAFQKVQSCPARLLLLSIPASLPTDPLTLWRSWDRRGCSVRISGDAGTVFSLALQGQPGSPGIIDLLRTQGVVDNSDLWYIDAGAAPASFSTRLSPATASILEYGALKPLRNEFLAELNKAPKSIQITDRVRSVLRRKLWDNLWPDGFADQARLQRFVIELFLSGNGAVIFPNSFVEWGAAEAMRRARPRVLIARFGMRIKPKPFTSIAVFENQQKISSVPDADDPQGSAVDAGILARYVWLAASRYPEVERTCCVCLAESSNSAFVITHPGNANRFNPRDAVTPNELCGWITEQLVG